MKQNLFKLGILCWLRGLMIYALITLPALFFLPMYLISIGLSIAGSILPGLAFAYIIQKLRNQLKSASLLIFMMIALLCTLISTWIATLIISSGHRALESYFEFLLFPIAACISCVLSIFSYRASLLASQPTDH